MVGAIQHVIPRTSPQGEITPPPFHTCSDATSVVVLPRAAVLHTTKGDITLKLFPDECPRTVENFTSHSKNCYYDGVIFHRIIKGFMLQTGDPLGEKEAHVRDGFLLRKQTH